MTQSSSSFDWRSFNEWFYDEYEEEMVLESEVIGAPDEEEDDSPMVLPAGATAIIHAGAGLYHGGAEGGPHGTSASSHETTIDGSPCRYSLRNTTLTLTGPLSAAQVLALLSEHVALECGRNRVLEEAMSSGDHREWARRYTTQGGYDPSPAAVLDGPPAAGMSHEQLLEHAVDVVGGGATSFEGFEEGRDGVVAIWSGPFG
jgi:hypothetical protein